MSRGWSLVVLVLSGVAMWLVVGWPSSRPAEPPPVVEPATISAAAQLPKLAKTEPRPRAATPPTAAEPPAQEPLPPPASPASSAPSGPQGDILQGDRGPVEEYRQLYQRQARDPEADHVERAIRSAFDHSQTPDLMQSASCHESICRVLIQWSPDRATGYILAMRWLALGTPWPPGQPGFDTQVALTAASKTDRDGSRLVELYLKRRPPSAAKPEPHH